MTLALLVGRDGEALQVAVPGSGTGDGEPGQGPATGTGADDEAGAGPVQRRRPADLGQVAGVVAPRVAERLAVDAAASMWWRVRNLEVRARGAWVAVSVRSMRSRASVSMTSNPAVAKRAAASANRAPVRMLRNVGSAAASASTHPLMSSTVGTMP